MTKLTSYLLLLVFLVTTQTLFGQEEQLEKMVISYDEWPTIEANANINNKIKYDAISSKFVLIGRQWDKRIITYFFLKPVPKFLLKKTTYPN